MIAQIASLIKLPGAISQLIEKLQKASPSQIIATGHQSGKVSLRNTAVIR